MNAHYPGEFADPKRAQAYGRVALDRACAEIVSAPNGAQEMTLHRGSYGIGGLVAIGALDYRYALDALIEAARRLPTHRDRWVGLERKVEASLRRGMERPRTPLEGCGQLQTAATRRYQPQATIGPGNGGTTKFDALRQWREAIDPRGTLAEAYLASRALSLGDDLASALNYVRRDPRREFQLRDLVEQLDDALALLAELSFDDNYEAWITGREADCLAGALADAAAFLHEQRERKIEAHANGARQ